MKFQKIKYSKCPNCKEYGLPAFGKVSFRYNPLIKCKYCEKKYRVNIFISTMVKICIAIFFGILGVLSNKYIADTNAWIWIWGFVAIILLVLFDYFSPLEEQK